MEWYVWAGLGYALIAAAIAFILSPQATTGRKLARCVFDAAIWPGWALLLLVEAAEEARRYWANGRFE